MGTLRAKTLELLRNRPRAVRLADIAMAADLPLTWLKSFHLHGEKLDSSVDKIQALYEHLTQTKLL